MAGDRVVQWDRMRDVVRGADAVLASTGVPPASVPDWLALVGDSADGFPGLPGFGAKSAATVLSRFGHLEAVPDDPSAWGDGIRAAGRLAATLREAREAAYLFRTVATLVTDLDLGTTVDDLAWSGPAPDFPAVCAAYGAPDLVGRVAALVAGRAG